MTKKTFSPARLVKGVKWYIVYYQEDPLSGKRVRFREKAGLNRIPNLNDRLKVARLLIKEINEKLPTGWPFHKEDSLVEDYMPLAYCVEQALNIKLNSPRKNTHRTYNSIVGIFLAYCRERNWAQMPIEGFSSRHAKTYMREIKIQRKLGEVTYNNYIIHLKAIWYEMKNEELFGGDNPWTEVKKLKPGDKKRRVFTEEEKKIAVQYIRDKDPQLYLAILFLYYCFIRPSELRRMRFKMIDPVKGAVILPASQTKSNKRRVVTIPKPLLNILRKPEILQYPINYYVFGRGLMPHPDQPCSHNIMNKRHKKYMKALEKSNLLHDIEGLTLYSWKDTGITDMSEHASLPALQSQAGHAKPETTMIYYQPDQINPEISNYDKELL